jgi:hypothetical protein
MLRRATAGIIVILFGALNGTFSLGRYCFDVASAVSARGGTRPADPYDLFLQDVRAATSPGDSIVIVAPAFQKAGSYGYTRLRAGYFLSGREVLPLLTEGNVYHADYLRSAKYVLVWGGALTDGVARTTVMRSRDGVLLRNE